MKTLYAPHQPNQTPAKKLLPVIFKKAILFTLIAGLQSLSLFAADETNLTSEIDNVTVFMQGAQIERNAKVRVKAGINHLVFDKLAAGIYTNTIRATGKGAFTIMDIKHRTKHVEAEPQVKDEEVKKVQQRIQIVKDSLEMVSFELSDIRFEKEAVTTEKNMLLKNRLVTGEAKRDSFPEFREAFFFLKEQIKDLNKELSVIHRKESKKTKEQQEIQTRLTNLENHLRLVQGKNQSGLTETRYQIVVTVAADVATYGSLSVNYYLPSAGWTPSYDLRADRAGQPMQLNYKANVYQNTGIDWESVKLKLSTLDPNRKSVKPDLATWYVQYYQPVMSRQSTITMGGGVPSVVDDGFGFASPEEELLTLSDSMVRDVKDKAAQKPAQTTVAYTQRNEFMTNMEFDIKLPYSIPADGQTHLVAVDKNTVKTDYQYAAVPKLSKEAFLMVSLTDWEDLQLLPAPANIYFAGTFVGQTQINPLQLQDTLKLTLGTDQSLVLDRKQDKNETRDTKLGMNKVKEVAYTITVKNTKATNYEVTLEDQIPVSRIKEIEVKAEDLAGAKLDEATGRLTWDLTLKPGETRKLEVSYTIKFPSDKLLASR